MSESALKVFHELTAAGLLSSDAVTQFSVEIESGVDALLDKLVKEEIITAYQSEKFRKGLASDICFGDYIVITELGRGGMGTVLLARHRVMDRKVAIKILPVTALESESAVARFYQEVKVAGKLTHPNIVHAYDAREHRGFHYLVMEYVDGHDLAQVVNEIGPLPMSLALDYIRQAALGIEYAHGENVVHRDIKPSNLLLDKQGIVKVLDMGLARVGTGNLEEQSLHLTTTGQVMGTVEFMSPEQAEDTRLADARSDIYSLGCTLYRLLANRGPYSRDTVVKTILAHRGDPIPRLPATGDPLQSGAQFIFERMVAKKPDDRYQNTSELLEDIDRIDELSESGELNSSPPVATADVVAEPSNSFSAPPSAAIPNPNPIGFAEQDFPKTAVAVRITDEVAGSAVDAFSQQYDSTVKQRAELNQQTPQAGGYGTIVDLSDNSTAHIAPDGSTTYTSSPQINPTMTPSEVFYIGDEPNPGALKWLVASVVAFIIACTPGAPLGLPLAIGILLMTRWKLKKLAASNLKRGTRFFWLAKWISILAIVAGAISCIVLLASSS